MNWEAFKPILTLLLTSGLKVLGGILATHGWISTGSTGIETFVGEGLVAGGAFWSWWIQSGHVAAANYLKKLTDTATQAAAIEVAKRMPLAAVTGAAAPAKAEATVSAPTVMAKDAAKAALILFAVLAIAAMSMQPASAQGRKTLIPTPSSAPAICDPLNLIPGCRPSSSAPATDSDQPCDITILTKLTPSNLMPTIKKCVSNVNGTLVNDTARALDSAKSFQPNPDQDAVNCLAPGLSLFKAGVQVPAVPEAPAVLNADGTVKTPAVAAIPAQDPGPILLFQKYREFTLAGGLTSCQNWVNTPVNATIAAGANAAGNAVAVGTGAALLAPK